MLLLAFAIAAAASATPLAKRECAAPNLPPSSTSKAFRLVANVTNPAVLENEVFAGLQYSAVETLRFAIEPDGTTPELGFETSAVFWQNDTTVGVEDPDSLPAKYTVLSDSGVMFTDALAWKPDADVPQHQHLIFKKNDGQLGFQISRPPFRSAELWFPSVGYQQFGLYACRREGWDQPPLFGLRLIGVGVEEEDNFEQYVPDTCTLVTLVPECAEQPELSDWAEYDREHAMDVRCYEDVSSIDWSKYS